MHVDLEVKGVHSATELCEAKNLENTTGVNCALKMPPIRQTMSIFSTAQISPTLITIARSPTSMNEYWITSVQTTALSPPRVV